MKIILSPTKKMREDGETLLPVGTPAFLKKTEKILTELRKKTYEELKTLWGCNDGIAELNVERLKEADLYKHLTPALLSYEGLAFQYMAPAVLDEESLSYIGEHLRILSGFYGVLKPMDGVIPYRLEMQAKLQVAGHKDLYSFWGDDLYKEIRGDDGLIINLASKEYYKCIEKYLTKEDRFLTCTFGEEVKGKFVTKGTYAKMARGEMVRYMAEHKISAPEELKNFDRLGYSFDEKKSTETEYHFNRTDGTEES